MIIWIVAGAGAPGSSTVRTEKMMTQVLIGDRAGRLIAEVNPLIGPISWRLNDIGKTTLTFSKNDSKVKERFLRPGNRVLIKFSSDLGLPNWGGVIDSPIKWTESTVEVSAYSIEYMLQYRITPKTRAFHSFTVAGIFRRLLLEANLEQPMGITIGRLWGGGRLHSPRYHYKSIWWVIKESLIKLEYCDVKFVPSVSAEGYIEFNARLDEKLGDDKSTSRALKEGRNVAAATLTEQGPIINQFSAVGAGSTWGTERKARVYQRLLSSNKYGLRQDSKVYSGVTMTSTLGRFASAQVQANSEPRVRLALEVANKLPAMFRQYDIGDELRCILPSYKFNGYDATVRVLSREYDPQTGKCRLVVEEEVDVEPYYLSDGSEGYSD